MASGCIVGDCWVCNEWVWEDEWDEEWFLAHEEMIHEDCAEQAKIIRQHQLLYKQEIESIKQDISDLKSAIDRLIGLVEQVTTRNTDMG